MHSCIHRILSALMVIRTTINDFLGKELESIPGEEAVA